MIGCRSPEVVGPYPYALPKFVPGFPGEPLLVPSLQSSTPVVAHRDHDGLCFGDARQQSLAAISWESRLGVFGEGLSGFAGRDKAFS